VKTDKFIFDFYFRTNQFRKIWSRPVVLGIQCCFITIHRIPFAFCNIYLLLAKHVFIAYKIFNYLVVKLSIIK